MLVLTLFAMAVPPVQGQGEIPPIEADLRFFRTLPIDEMQPVYETPGACGSRPPGTSGPDHFKDRNGDHFTFREEREESGCGEAQFVVKVPAGAEVLRVRFSADRIISTLADQPAAAPRLLQHLLLYDSVTDGPLERHAYFADTDPATMQSRDFDYLLQLVPGRGSVVLAWLFADRGAAQSNAGPTVTLGHQFSATVKEVELEFLGLEPTVVDIAPAGQDLSGTQVLHHTRMRIGVPDHVEDDVSARVTISISNRFGVSSVNGPDGGRVLEEELEARQADGVLRLILDEHVTRKYGAGVYEVTFTAIAPLVPSPTMLAVFVAMVTLPLATGFFATRGVLGFSRRATTGRYAQTARLLQAVLVGLWIAYLATMLWIATSRQLVDTMNAWPLHGAGAIYYLLLLVLALAFTLLALLSSRHLQVWMENDLRERERAQRELERSNRELEQFAYVASHDLQEPLRMVTHYTKLLEMRYKDKLDDDARDFIGYATDGASRMKQLIDGLLTYSRVGRTEVKREQMEADVAVKRALLNLRLKVQESGADVSTGHLPKVRGDATMLTELFQNLIENAIKYCREGIAPKVHVHAERDGNRGWRFTVQDNGIGIPQKHHKRIFQLFQRLHGRDDYSGTGLGLAICQRIVDLHGGRIWVESVPNKGSAFHFTIPDRLPASSEGLPTPARKRLTTQVPTERPEV